MKLPTMTELNAYRNMIDIFGGYNHNLRIGDGEFYDMKNLSSDNYPILSPRKSRGEYNGEYSDPQALITKDSLCYVDGADFVINGHRVDMKLSTDAEMCPKTLISMGAYVIIMPDKKWVKTIASKDEVAFEHGGIEAKFDSASTVTFFMCKADGEGWTNISATEPTITEAMKSGDKEIPLWLDTSTKPHALKQYSLSNAMWSTVPVTYIKIECDGIGNYFEVGDGVTISGIEGDYITDQSGGAVSDDVKGQLKDLNNTMVIQSKGENYIVVIGVLEAVAQINGTSHPIKVERKMPTMDYIIESGNRLWGCHYGEAINGEMINEIYASKLGDFKNWHCYAGISTDSYAVTVGTDGKFTGAVAHLGYPLFFKENYMHKVYGSYPAQYQIQTITCRGVQDGSHKSLATVNEVLYYKSRTGICAYDGSLPQEISYQLGDVPYTNAVAGSHGNKYYISMQDNTSQSHLFVYDASKGMWHKEDNLKVDDFCSCRGELYYISNGQIKTMFGGGNEAFDWMAETGIIGLDSPDHKYISKLNVRMSLAVGTSVTFSIQYDSSGEWEHLFTMEGKSLRSFTVPIKPKRCDHMRLRIEGKGECKIFSIAKTVEDGSDWQ